MQGVPGNANCPNENHFNVLKAFSEALAPLAGLPPAHVDATELAGLMIRNNAAIANPQCGKNGVSGGAAIFSRCGGGAFPTLFKPLVYVLHRRRYDIVDDDMGEKYRAYCPERAHVIGILMSAMRFLAGEGFREQDLVGMIGHRDQFDIEAIGIAPAFLQMITRRLEILLTLARLGYENPMMHFIFPSKVGHVGDANGLGG